MDHISRKKGHKGIFLSPQKSDRNWVTGLLRAPQPSLGEHRLCPGTTLLPFPPSSFPAARPLLMAPRGKDTPSCLKTFLTLCWLSSKQIEASMFTEISMLVRQLLQDPRSWDRGLQCCSLSSPQCLNTWSASPLLYSGHAVISQPEICTCIN